MKLNLQLNVEEFKANWDKSEIYVKNESFELITEPFKVCRLFNFLKSDDSAIDHLVKEFSSVDFDRRQMDLYEFYQSTDLSAVKSRAIKGFYQMLQSEMMPLMQKLTGIELTHISASVSMYNSSDYLLVHDDMMADRQIAFVFYLSPWKQTWTEEMGGALELFAHKDRQPFFPVVRKIPPINNQFLFFKVCESSFHQVGEVTTFEYPRLTINGWFHGPKVSEVEPKIPIANISYFPTNKWPESNLNRFINPIYLKEDFKEDIQKQIEDNSEASLEEFLDEDFYDQIVSQIQSIPNEKWITQGPANLRNYEVLPIESAYSFIKTFCELLGSEGFFKLLYDYTELDLWGDAANSPKCSIEIQRWTQGCYTVLGDSSSYQDSTLDLIFYLNAYPQVGVVTYLSPEEEHDEDDAGQEEEELDPILLTIHPKDNALNVVYRSEGTTKFTKYVSKNCLQAGKYSYIFSCRYKE